MSTGRGARPVIVVVAALLTRVGLSLNDFGKLGLGLLDELELVLHADIRFAGVVRCPRIIWAALKATRPARLRYSQLLRGALLDGSLALLRRLLLAAEGHPAIHHGALVVTQRELHELAQVEGLLGAA